jgi:hypothetical protein
MSMIDVFSKFAVVIPIKIRFAVDVIPALFQAFKIMGQQPEILYSDDEPALHGDLTVDAYKEANIQHVVAGSAHFIERFNRTFKNMMTDRMNQIIRGVRLRGKQTPADPTLYQWTDLVPHVMAEYNKKKNTESQA